jgi:hypothetical protein
MMAKFVGSHDDVVRTKTGHVVVFKAGEESWVPDDQTVIKLVKQAGHQPVATPKASAEPKAKPDPVRKTSE